MPITGGITLIHRGNECDVEWKMDFPSLSKQDGAYYWSTEFSFECETWYFAMYPNYCKSFNSSGGIHLRLWRNTSNGPPITVEFTFSIKAANGQKIMQTQRIEDFKGYSCHDIKRFIYTSDFLIQQSEFLVSGSLTLVCTLKRCTTGSSSTDYLSESSKVLEDFKELFLQQKECDVVIRVKDQEFSAHRAILIARSSVFEATFRSDMKEKATGIINIEDCDPTCFSDFLHFLYCGNPENISEENVFSLFVTADKYDVKDLTEKCIKIIKTSLSVDIFCDAIALALKYSENELIQLATYFFAKNLQKIIVTVKWLSFLAENPTQSNELFIKALVTNKNSDV